MAKARILAVDDQLYFRTFLEDVLTREGYEVRTAASGEDALRQLERDRFDVVLTDLVMPGMDGRGLVQRVKEQWPEQDVVVVTSVGDVKTAVEAMRLGATDYQLKPIDRQALCCSLDALLQRRRLREEHGRLMAENLEFLAVMSLYERAAALFSTLALEPLADRLIELLCLETRAQGGILWVAPEEGSRSLRLVGLRGIVRIDEEPDEITPCDWPDALQPLARGERASLCAPSGGGRTALHLAFRSAGRLVAAARLSDRLDGREFGDRDRAGAEKLAELGAQALANALRFRALEHRSFRDPATRAYTPAFLEDVARNEIQKATRFGRTFSLLTLALEADGTGSPDTAPASAMGCAASAGLAHAVGRVLRSTDLLAAGEDGRFTVLLPETDALGAAVLKRRIRESLAQGDALRDERGATLRPRLAAVTFGADGTQLDGLAQTLEARLDEERESVVTRLALESASFPGTVEALLAQRAPAPPDLADDAMRFLLDEVVRRPRDRGLLFLAPGGPLRTPLRESIERLRGVEPGIEIVLVADGAQDLVAGTAITLVSPRQAGTRAGFAVQFGEGPSYALVRGGDGDAGEGLFHSGERALAEHLAFQLQREIGIPVAAVAGGGG